MGIEARTILGGKTVEGSVLSGASGNVLPFKHTPTTSDEDTFGAFLGVSGTYDVSDRLVANTGLEGLVESTGDYQVSGTVGFRLRF